LQKVIATGYGRVSPRSMMQKPGSDCAEEKSPSQARPTLDRKKDRPRGLKRGALRSESEQAGCYRVPVIRLVSEPIYSLADQASEIRLLTRKESHSLIRTINTKKRGATSQSSSRFERCRLATSPLNSFSIAALLTHRRGRVALGPMIIGALSCRIVLLIAQPWRQGRVL
jgi:hypothetical protein